MRRSFPVLILASWLPIATGTPPDLAHSSPAFSSRGAGILASTQTDAVVDALAGFNTLSSSISGTTPVESKRTNRSRSKSGIYGLVAAAAASPTPLPRAHAHNDYLHPRPLLDALDQGFCSVEADIFLIGDEFRVGHSRGELRPGRTLESLYLQPLAERVRTNHGSVYPRKERFILLIDIKSDANQAYPVLDKLLTRYQHLFTAHLDDQPRPGPITAILSGNRPRALLEADSSRYCSIDGRLPDLGGGAPVHFLPLISDNWSNHFKWRGDGEIPPGELAKLKALVARTHQENRLLRFWAVPDREACWRILHQTGVDLINTDKLADLAAYLNGLQEN